jgi:phosphotransacetylase
MDSEYYEDLYIEMEAKWVIQYRSNLELLDDELVAACEEIKDKYTSSMICGIIHYFSMWGKITKKQRDVLLNYLTNQDMKEYCGK